MADTAPLFKRQHGVASDRQLRELGVSWGRQQRMIANNHWRRFAAGVIAVAGSPSTWEQKAMAATLSTGGLVMLAGGPAARLHRFDGFLDTQSVEVALPYGGHDNTADDVSVRWSRHLSLKDRHTIDSIPVTIQPVTLIHLAASGLNAAQALDSALRQRKSPSWFRQHFERWRRPRVAGPDEMLALLEERMGKRLPLSWFQRLAATVLAQHGVVLEDEWPVHDAQGELIATLDLACAPLKVGLECQSIEFHATAADFARDIHRKRLVRRMGWDIVELWWSDLERIDGVVDDVGAAFDRARRLLA